MKLILKEDVQHLGEAGQVVTVKPGYARNYLLPQGLAYEASEANLQKIEEEQRQAEERARRDYLEARRRASILEGTTVSFRERAAEGDEDAKLFGSVSAADVTDRLNEEGELDFQLERKQVLLDDPIKNLGSHEVTVRLHEDVDVTVHVSVEREEG